LLESIYSGRFEPRGANQYKPSKQETEWEERSGLLGKPRDQWNATDWQRYGDAVNETIAKADQMAQSVLNRRSILDQRARQLLKDSPEAKKDYDAQMKSLAQALINTRTEFGAVLRSDAKAFDPDSPNHQHLMETMEKMQTLSESMAILPETIAHDAGVSGAEGVADEKSVTDAIGNLIPKPKQKGK
jgi:hypothetical protein